ncbi:peptide chain release factor N(5)-glutamine methyltransferase [Caproicibacterium sp. XB2]|uniref:peptide chain release factor N(5)-glutamine methyltransferase n=1 Tax=Caproicibacterium sp. XB2 TaxID=3388458 RepID=UPI000A28DCC7|nr:protein-(glutamine-N5) methyltransferase, release factor-specific [Ruminococcaceae bacterium CPB6]
MTNEQAYLKAKKILQQAGNESPAFDAVCLCQKVLHLDRPGLAVHGHEPADERKAEQLLRLAEKRAAGEPLQYLLEKWPFLNLELAVGEGVLCPREETELLVHSASRLLPQGVRVLDLCAGSGAVGLELKSLRPDLTVACGEKYPQAFAYLQKNCRAYLDLAVTPLSLDAFSKADAASCGLLGGFLCNPPYVRAGEIPGLQTELHYEPETAIDGGTDGLQFYRAISKLWIPQLQPGGLCAVEIGESQAAAVSALFTSVGLEKISVIKDFNQFDRVVLGWKPTKK